jgi:hypothetical protein
MMKNVDAHSKTVRELLSGTKYALDFYQRDYRWETRHIADLFEDLEDKFLSSHQPGDERGQVEHYAHYFLGPIVISQRSNQHFIIDGQQRLTTLTLLLIYLNHLQASREDNVEVRSLIFSEKYGRKSFNLDIHERTRVIEALFHGEPYDAVDGDLSIRNILLRYADIERLFPDILQGAALPFFMDWLLDNVEMIEITAFTDDDAYTIFETMNDRGLGLRPTDMLKGYLLANIRDPKDQARANDVWRQQMRDLVDLGKEGEADFFKAWLRAKYADSMSDHKKGAVKQDFEKIGAEFHKWVRDRDERIGLNESDDFRRFVEQAMPCFARHYVQLRGVARELTPGVEYVFYNALNNLTLQYPLILAPLRQDDDVETTIRKIRLVSGYLDILTARRIVNFRSLSYTSIVDAMFVLMKEIRELSLADLATLLRGKVDELPEAFDGVAGFYMHSQNRPQAHYLLARITHYLDTMSGVASDFESYMSRTIAKPFEVEHIWPDQYEGMADQFATPFDFALYRNRIGGLVLLPRGINQSLGSAPYSEKLKTYASQNLLARSLSPACYEKNPTFLSYVKRSKLPFRPYTDDFTKDDLDGRQELYRLICEEIWSPTRFERELT